ncbi:hypothetical protein [Streptomyces sp. NPDC127033]|uniref:hypothetical protein n=1 Tax=Streptomyces sp. NPDC127033 TaxID=3347110 RepID=UPI0036684997
MHDPTHPHVPGIRAFAQAAVEAAGFRIDTELWQPGPRQQRTADPVPNCGDNDCEVNCESGPN